MKEIPRSRLNYNKIMHVERYKSSKLIRIYPGKLKVPTGKIVAGDPFFIFNCHYFEKTISPGEYDVELTFLNHPTAGARVALARLVISKQEAEYWELALLESEDVKELKEGEFIGFAVDSGLASFVDQQICKEFNAVMDKLYRENEGFNYYDNVLAAEFAQNAFNNDDSTDIGDWVNHRFDSHKEDNIIIFSSGYGDGLYPVYWGIDKNEKISSLLIDFFVLPK